MKGSKVTVKGGGENGREEMRKGHEKRRKRL